MTIQTHSYEHRGYEIVVTHTAPYFQAAIYPKDQHLPHVGWEEPPIRAHNVMGAVTLAKGRIDSTFAALHIP